MKYKGMLKSFGMEVKVEKQPKSTIKLTIKVPADKVKAAYDKVLTHAAEHAEIEGFRKGKAPKEMVEKRAKPSELNGETVNELLQEYYVAAVKEHMLSPIGNPKVMIKSFDKTQDFEFEATLAVKPEIKLGDFRKKLKDLQAAKAKETDDSKKLITVDDVIQAISGSAEVEVSDILIEDEVTRMLSRLLQQTEALGLSVEQYLSAQNKKLDDLRKEYETAAEKGLKSEFALGKAIEEEKIEVSDKEIEDTIEAMPDAALKSQLQKGADRWYIISILSKNKLIRKLMDELEPAEKKEEIQDDKK